MPLFAGQWADRDYQIPGWIALPEGSTPIPGDIIAEAHSVVPGVTPTGHVGFVVNKDGKLQSVSADSDTGRIKLGSWGFRKENHPTIRRYVGVGREI